VPLLESEEALVDVFYLRQKSRKRVGASSV